MSNYVKFFTISTAALCGVAAYLIANDRSRQPMPLVGRGTATAMHLGSSASGLATAPYLVILPPRVSRSETAAVTETFLKQCQEIETLGLPSGSEVRCYGGYLASLNYERRIPNWVMEVVDHRRLHGASTYTTSPAVSSGDDDDANSVSSGNRNSSTFFCGRHRP